MKKKKFRARSKISPLVTDHDRRRRILICLKVLEVYDRIQGQFGKPDWVGHAHPVIQRQGIHNFVIDWKLKSKDKVDRLRTNCEYLRGQLEIAETIDADED